MLKLDRCTMKIAILEYSYDQKSATGVRGRAIKNYLEQNGDNVEVLAPDAKAIERFQHSRYGFSSRVTRRLLRRRRFRTCGIFSLIN
jgi:hypothetical protein